MDHPSSNAGRNSPRSCCPISLQRLQKLALSSSEKDATTTLTPERQPLFWGTCSYEWEGPGITDTELEGGSVITNPVRQIEKLLKLQGFDRDATEISAAAAVAASKGLGGALVFTDAEETLRRALERIAESYNATVFLAADGAGIALPDPNASNPTIAAHLDPTNILQGGLQLANVEEVGSRIDYRFNFSPVQRRSSFPPIRKRTPPAGQRSDARSSTIPTCRLCARLPWPRRSSMTGWCSWSRVGW